MKNKRIMVLVAALCLVGMSALLVACGGSTDTSGNSDAQKQFLEDRGAGTPGSGTPVAAATAQADPGAGAGGFGGGFGGGVFGTIDKVDGNKITVTGQNNGTTTTVQLAADGKIFKQTTLTSTDIKVGAVILAAGTRSGDALDASTVQVGDLASLQASGGRLGGFGGFPGAGQGGQFPQGTPGAGRTPVAGRTPGARRGAGTPIAGRTPGTGGGNRAGFTPTLGTVEKIDGTTITIAPISMSNTTGTPTTTSATQTTPITTIHLTTTTRVQKQSELAVTDLQAGMMVTAQGTQNGDVFDATRVQVVDGTSVQQPTP